MNPKEYQTESPFTEKFQKRGGKYLNWAREIDEETLYTVLWMVGELACAHRVVANSRQRHLKSRWHILLQDSTSHSKHWVGFIPAHCRSVSFLTK